MNTEKTGQATYSPEDNKLRLYVGRVPRDEYEKLRAEGWTSTPKQDCDFVATWTPSRVKTCLFYADIIEDEDQSPEDRAADRAERFGGYLEKRLNEATSHADRYDSGPTVHGFQSEKKAERAAARHDRIGTYASNAWSKAEYWQHRTAGVIAHALHKSSPDVRMGRIKEIESDIRRIEASHKKAHAEHAIKHSVMLALVEHSEGKREKMLPYPGWQYSIAYIREADGLTEDAGFTPEQMRRCMIRALFSGEHSGKWDKFRDQITAGTVQAAEVAREWLNAYGWEKPKEWNPTNNEWHQHLTLRLAYENQMLEAAGGRAGHIEMIPGGFLGGRQITKVNKSSVTGRIVSVDVRDNKPSLVNHWGNPYKDGIARTLIHNIKVERLAPGSYRAPTEEELAAFQASQKEAKKNAPKKDACPLINPTKEEAEKLQALLNAEALADHCRRHMHSYGKDYAESFKPSTICAITQAQYSAVSTGSYAKAETRGLCKAAQLEPRFSNCWSGAAEEAKKRRGPALCKIRITQSNGSDYGAKRVIILTDKPQKPLPSAVWDVRETETITA